MITGVLGRPGDGKGVTMVTLGYEMALVSRLGRLLGRRPRPLYATFDLDRSRRLLDQRDILAVVGDGETWGTRDAVILVDEMGIEADSRQTMSLDPLLDMAWRLHRKAGVDLLYAAQHPRQVDVRCLMLTGQFVVVRRVLGPDGTRALKRSRASGRTTHWWQRPWLFHLRWFGPADFDADWELKPAARALRSRWMLFDPAIAGAYRTDEMVYPVKMARYIQQVERSAPGRLLLPPTRVANGITQPAVWSDLSAVRMLAPMSAKHNVTAGELLAEMSGVDPDVRAVLRNMSLYVPGEVPEGEVVAELRAPAGRLVPLRGRIVSVSRVGTGEYELVVLDETLGAHQVLPVPADWVRGAGDLVGRQLRAVVRVVERGGVPVCSLASDPLPEVV